MQPVGVEARRQGERVVAGFGPVGVEAELPRIVARAQEAGVLSGPGEWAFDQADRQGHAVGHAVVSAPDASSTAA